MKNKVLIGLVVFTIVVSGCATSFNTEKSNWTGGRGFTQTQLGNDTWQIKFTGNIHTDNETRKSYILQKAAQIAIKDNYSFFKILQSETSEDITKREGMAKNTKTRARGRAKLPYVHTNVYTIITVKLLNEKDGVDGVVYNANSLLQVKGN